MKAELKGDANTRTGQLVKLIYELGPDIPEISRRLGQYKESVRYRYKEKILGKGFSVQASVDHEKLGLRRVMMILDFSKEFEPFAESILSAMSQLCYLVGYARTFLEGSYVANLSVPVAYTDEITRFFLQMKEEGMFTRLEVLDFDWVRQVPMKAEFYDFDTGRWDFDLSTQTVSDFRSAVHAPSPPAKFDYVDLLLIKELQMDANKSLKDIAERLELNYKKLVWHYGTHVIGRRLIRGYSVNWMGTRYDYAAERALHRKHRYFALHMFAKGVNGTEIMRLRERIDRLPFLWAEASGRNYFAEFSIPVDHMVEGIQYITEAIADIKERVEVHTIDQAGAIAFTVPYTLYNSELKQWTFDRFSLAHRFEELVVRIKGSQTSDYPV